MNRLLALLLILLCGGAAADDDLDASFERGILIIIASEYACHRFDIYIAASPAQRERGLMFVRELPQTSGMLFVYEADMYLSMWMKNTFIPLDMLFVRADGTVSSVEHDTEPRSLRSISSLERVRYVIELNAGTTERLSIDQYSSIAWQRSADDK